MDILNNIYIGILIIDRSKLSLLFKIQSNVILIMTKYICYIQQEKYFYHRYVCTCVHSFDRKLSISLPTWKWITNITLMYERYL